MVRVAGIGIVVASVSKKAISQSLNNIRRGIEGGNSRLVIVTIGTVLLGAMRSAVCGRCIITIVVIILLLVFILIVGISVARRRMSGLAIVAVTVIVVLLVGRVPRHLGGEIYCTAIECQSQRNMTTTRGAVEFAETNLVI